MGQTSLFWAVLVLLELGSRGIGQGESSCSGSGFCNHRHNEPHRQSSARNTIWARNALRST